MEDRRTVISGIAAALAAGAAPQALAQARGLSVGVIGAGWFGKLNLNALMQIAPVSHIAFCDVDRRMREEALALALARRDSVLPQTEPAALFADYREMLAARAYDIVIVATPDHWHALAAIAAMERGAHVYIEKPVSVDVREAQALVATARRTGVTVQVNTQRRTAPFAIEARERVLRAGLLGAIGHVEVFGYFHQRPVRFAAPSSPPAQLDWDFYCGPAPLLPYRPDIHPIQWRAFEAFGNGYMGDIGVHFVDLSRWMLGLGWPRRIASAGGAYVARESASDLPDVQTATFAYDHLLMTWTNRQWGRAPDPRRQWGTAIHGERGTLFVSGEGYEYAPREGDGFSGALDMEAGRYAGDAAMPEWERPLQVMTRWHMRDFLAAIAARRAPAASIEEGAISTSCCVLANIALRLGRTLEWDAENQRVIGDDAANALLARPYRAPWRRPAIA